MVHPMLSCTLNRIRSLIETFPKPQILWLVAMKLQLSSKFLRFDILRIYEEEVSRSSWRWHCLSSIGKSSGCQRAEDSAAQLERVRIPNKDHIGKSFDDLMVWLIFHFYFYGVGVFSCTLPLTWWQIFAFSNHKKTVLDLHVLFRIWKAWNSGPEMFHQWLDFLSPNWPENLVRKYQHWRSLEAREATAQRHKPNIHSSVANQQWWKRP